VILIDYLSLIFIRLSELLLLLRTIAGVDSAAATSITPKTILIYQSKQKIYLRN
jgi:hypothetical protein